MSSDFTFTTRHIHNWVSFLVWLSLFILSGAISLLFSSSILDTYWPGRGRSSFSVTSSNMAAGIVQCITGIWAQISCFVSVCWLTCVYIRHPFPLSKLSQPTLYSHPSQAIRSQILRVRKAVFPVCLGTGPGFSPLFLGPNSLMSELFLWIPLMQVALFCAWSFPNTSWDCCRGVRNRLWDGIEGCEDSDFLCFYQGR